jgi:hypothetical protein
MGAAMGFTPREVDEMTLWELSACIDGYNEANSADDPTPPHMSSEEFDEMMVAHLRIIKGGKA